MTKATLEYIENGAGQVEIAAAERAQFNVEFRTATVFTVEAATNYELLLGDRSPSRRASRFRSGGYHFNDVDDVLSASASSGACRARCRCSWASSTTARSRRSALQRRACVDPQAVLGRAERLDERTSSCPSATFTTTVFRARTDYGFSPRMFASALLQYSSSDHVFSSNLRFRWEYLPGSELFVVYTDERDTIHARLPGLKNRAFVVKINRLFRF